ncbi:MAG TPA: EamA family transporter [Gemmatimonadaceae bacterium]|jgi:drug/metabolite transporter (DMT)-like permease|nr:EamA family transporter [Gemmatimonadaceae bacterium]
MGSTATETVTPGHATTRPGVWLTDIALVLMALIWGVNFSIVKFGTTLVAPLAYNGLRVMIAAVVLMTIVLAAKTPLPPRRVIVALLTLGVLGNGIYQFFFVQGIARTRASDAALVVAASPAFIAIIGRLRGVERASTRRVMGILLSIAGIALVVFATTRGDDGRSSLAGDMLVLAGSLSWATYTVLLKPYTEHVSGIQVSAFTMVGGAVPLFVVALPAIVHASWSTVPLLGWGALFYSAIFALVIAYLFWYRGVRVIGPTRTAMYSNVQPLIAVIFAWVVLNETPTIWQGIGMVFIMTGLVLTRT